MILHFYKYGIVSTVVSLLRVIIYHNTLQMSIRVNRQSTKEMSETSPGRGAETTRVAFCYNFSALRFCGRCNYIETMKGVDGKTGHATGSHGSIGHGSRMPAILYVDCNFVSGIDRKRLDGLRRYAAARKWRVETLEHKDCSPAALREALARYKPIGCAAECCHPDTLLRPALFGGVPVVYFDPPDRPAWRSVRAVSCDEAAVAKMAFRELSSTSPPAYAVVSHWKTDRWVRERIDAFRDCCRAAGTDCTVSYFPFKCDAEFEDCVGRMVPWVSALPRRCAVFAVNDQCAIAVAKAIAEAGRSFPRSMTLVGADGVWQPPWFEELAETISSIRLDHEQAGFLAAKALGAFAANYDPRSAWNDDRRCAANNGPPCGRNNGLSSVPPKAASSLLASPASSLRAKPAPSLVFPPLIVERRKSTRGYGRRDPRILEAMEMIRREACEGLTVAKLAQRFRGSRRLFEIRFREAAGHTALDEIINVRLDKAMELLAHTDMPVTAIPHFCGFNTRLDFWKVFRRRTGMSPLQFRNVRK